MSPIHHARRWLWLLLAYVALGLGIVGVFLPGLPTTPFVLLAAACYAKASPRLHTWLLNHRLTGPMLRDWESDRSLTRRSKAIAVGSMPGMGTNDSKRNRTSAPSVNHKRVLSSVALEKLASEILAANCSAADAIDVP